MMMGNISEMLCMNKQNICRGKWKDKENIFDGEFSLEYIVNNMQERT